MFYKTEGHGNGIKLAITDSLASNKWIEQPGYKQQTQDAVEGSSVFQLINSDTYILMYDVYMKGTYQFCESKDLDVFSIVDNEVTMNFHPRHGSVIPVTRRELKTLTNKWGIPEGFEMPTDRNPVLEGYYADPEILYSNKTGKYYLYPTSDGFQSWGGYYFKTFSSDNLKDWTDEGVILDFHKDLTWADKNAWAPTIIERKMPDDSYKYFYYYSADKKIGVAVSDAPTGPFTDPLGKPLIDYKLEGQVGGQQIDPDVFKDPQTGKYYLYWGCGYLAVAELNDDMISIKPGTAKRITPPNFTEGAEVFYRNGLYYFMWSENDTRSEDYRVRYATAKLPEGPLEIPNNNLILSKIPELGIYGTGHNCVLQMPQSDEWYIIYHRFGRPTSIKMGRAAGYHREVCIDKLEFNEDGSIKKVTPTL